MREEYEDRQEYNIWQAANNTGDAIAPEYWLDQERTFVASLTAETVDNGESINILIENNDDTRKSYFYFGELFHTDDVNLTLHTEVENVTGQTPLEVSNNAIGSDQDTMADVNEVGTFDSLDTHQEQIYLGGGERSIFDGYRILILPGESILIEAESLTGGNGLGIRLAWADIAGEIGERLT